MKTKFVGGVLFLAIAATFLVACGEGAQTEKPQGQVQSDPLEPRYQATLSEGITFKNPGYPFFVTSVKGISIPESFGRWTDNTQAAIEFSQPLPKKFTLKVTATRYQPTMGEPIKIVIGGRTYEADFPKEWDFKEVVIPVVNDGDAKSITFELPNAKVPKVIGQGVDARNMCLALSSIKIIEQ